MAISDGGRSLSGTVGHSAPPLRQQSVAFRLAVSLFVVLSLATGATIFAAYSYGRTAADEAFDEVLAGAAGMIMERVFVVDGETVADVPTSAFDLLSLGGRERVFYRIVLPGGQTLTGYDDLTLPPDREGQSGPFGYSTSLAGVPLRAMIVTKPLAERSVTGNVNVIVAHTRNSRNILAREITTRAVAVIAAAGLAIFVLAIFVLRYAMRPLERVEAAILTRRSSDLSPFAMDAPREVSALVGAINHFMGRLDRRVNSMQAFVADAAHQLRTPITALLAQTDLALNERDADRLKVLHRRIRSRAIGLNRLTNQLLSHALVTHRADSETLTELDLRRVAIEAEREFRLTTERETPAVVLDLEEEPVLVTGDSFSLKEAVKNLLNNAVSHGKPPLRLHAGHTGNGQPEIRVSDCGDGMSAEYEDTLGRRFQRDASKTESAGLGLAIVKEVADFHGASLYTQRQDGMFSIGFRFPKPDGKTA